MRLHFFHVLFPLIAMTAPGTPSLACTVFKVTQNGYTIVGNNEDAWSVNAQVRFEQGRDGGYGAIYFDHFNGHPFKHMGPQLGMNEAGLVFDGLSIQPQHTTPVPGRERLQFDDLIPMVMRTCATVHEAATLFRSYDFSWLTRSMLFLADRNGDYLILESDTMILGNDPTYAVGNWRMGACTDPDAIPIPRLQAGRALLRESATASVEHGIAILESMKACRSKLGEGTLFSTLFDPQRGQAHLFFYHDFRERVTFDLKQELAKGDRVVPMASLFTPNVEYAALQGYITPFHHRWLWWGLAGLPVLAMFVGLFSLVSVLRWTIARLRRKASSSLLPPVLMGFASALLIGLVGVLLLNEGVYYFGLGYVSPALDLLPWLFSIVVVLLLTRTWRTRATNPWTFNFSAALFLPLAGLLVYWGMFWP